MVTVQLNGERIALEQPLPLDQFLMQCLRESESSLPFAVALNGVFVPKQDYSLRLLKDYDALEVLRPIVGG